MTQEQIAKVGMIKAKIINRDFMRDYMKNYIEKKYEEDNGDAYELELELKRLYVMTEVFLTYEPDKELKKTNQHLLDRLNVLRKRGKLVGVLNKNARVLDDYEIGLYQVTKVHFNEKDKQQGYKDLNYLNSMYNGNRESMKQDIIMREQKAEQRIRMVLNQLD